MRNCGVDSERIVARALSLSKLDESFASFLRVEDANSQGRAAELLCHNATEAAMGSSRLYYRSFPLQMGGLKDSEIFIFHPTVMLGSILHP